MKKILLLSTLLVTWCARSQTAPMKSSPPATAPPRTVQPVVPPAVAQPGQTTPQPNPMLPGGVVVTPQGTFTNGAANANEFPSNNFQPNPFAGATNNPG